MHILLLPSWYDTVDKPWRGTFFRDQALSLMRYGMRVGVAFVERRSLKRLRPARLAAQHFQIAGGVEGGIPTMRMKGWSTFAHTTPGSLIWAMLTRRLVHAYVEEHGVPDVVHGHAAMWGGHAARLCARDLRRPFVVTEHSGNVLTMNLSRGDRRRVANVYGEASAVIAVSHALKRSVDRIAGRAVAEVVPNTVDSTFFRLPPRERAVAPFVFLAVADLVPAKRLDLLLAAFARLYWCGRDVRLVLVGAGRERERLQRLAQTLAVSHLVKFTGPLPRDGVRQEMWDANALVVPSDVETFGVVLIEALSTGLPVVATRSGGPQEIVRQDTGSLVPCGDEDALRHAMSGVMERRFDPYQLRESTRFRFGYPTVAQRHGAIYVRVALRHFYPKEDHHAEQPLPRPAPSAMRSL